MASSSSASLLPLVLCLLFSFPTGCAAARPLPAGTPYTFLDKHPHWSGPAPLTLTYAFSTTNFIHTISFTDAEAALARAFGTWAEVIPITFLRTDDYENANITIGFYAGDHGDGYPFDGKNGVAAHAIWPEVGAREAIHFDSAESWSVGYGKGKHPCRGGIDLEGVAVHEIGHVLGLGHSSDPHSVMYPFHIEGVVDLTAGDIEGAQVLYGPNPNFRRPRDYCDRKKPVYGDVCADDFSISTSLLILLLILLLFLVIILSCAMIRRLWHVT